MARRVATVRPFEAATDPRRVTNAPRSPRRQLPTPGGSVLARPALVTVALAAASVLAPPQAGAQAGAPAGAPAAPRPAPTASAAPAIPRGNRWQLQLTSGAYLFDVRPLRAAGDSLVVTRLDSTPAPPVTLALAEIEELRLVQPTELSFVGLGGGRAQNPYGELMGAGDVVFPLAGVDAAERRRIVAEVVRAAAVPAPTPRAKTAP
jgi:hypothetical protein